MWGKVLTSVVLLAIVAVVFASPQTTAAIQQIGGAFVKLTTNIVGGSKS